MNNVLILMYHGIDTPMSREEHRFCAPPAEFMRQMTWLNAAGYCPVTLDAVLGHVNGTCPVPENAVHITFDDGFVGVFDHAFPVLKKLQIPATLFALPATITNEWMWRRGFPRRALLSGAQLRMLADEGLTIGSHTRTHPRLPEISPHDAQTEITTSKAELETLLGREVAHFAYPYGLFNDQIRDLVAAAGYRSACSTRSGFNRPGSDPFLLRRIDIFGTDQLWQFKQKLRFGTNDASWLRPLAYYGQRLAARLGAKKA